MFYLVKFDNGKFSIVKAKNVEQIKDDACIVKCNGGKYQAFIVAASDNNTKLLRLKEKEEVKDSGNLKRLKLAQKKSSQHSRKRIKKLSNCGSSSTSTSSLNNNSTPTTTIYGTRSNIETSLNNTSGTTALLCNTSTKTNSPTVPTSIYNSTIVSYSNASANNNENISSESHFPDLSSEYQNNSNFSEYVPSFSNINEETLNSDKSISKNNETVCEIDLPLNINHVSVPYSKTSKKHFCTFCKKMQTTLSRHLFLKHKNEEEVRRAFNFPKKSKDRLKIMNDIRKRGDFEHNTSTEHNTGILIVSRQQQNKCRNVVDDYVCCKICKGFFSKRTIRIHKVRCGTSTRSNQIDGRRLTQYIHPAANNTIKTKIFPVLRCDEVTKTIRYDELAIKFGNYLAEKYSLQHQHDMIRANLRLLGRFMIELKKLDNEVCELKSIYNVHLFDKCITAIRTVANWNEDLMLFGNPAVAQNLASLIKKCGKRQRVEYIKESRDDLKAEVEKFLTLWEEEIPLVNRKAVEDQSNKKRLKKITLPSKHDIKTLYLYLKEKVISNMGKVLEKFCTTNWTQLVQATLIFIQLFNRRRAGEIERLTVENFKNKEIITDSVDKDILSNVSKESVIFAKQFVRICLRGKLGRTVSVLLCPISIKAIEVILKHRLQAGVDTDNVYIFSKPTTSKLSKPYYRACPLLKMFSMECGASIPQSLRGTTLRKHIATYTSLLNIEEGSVDTLANFMGHHKDIHKNIYRVSIPVAEITCVSKLLMAAVGNEDDGDDDGKADDSASSICSEEHIEPNNSSSTSKKRRSTSPFGKTKRKRWNTAERDAISAVFGNVRKLQKLPTFEECSKAVSESPALCNRTPQQVKSWIDNQRRFI